MAISKELASVKRFGPRYGRTIKHRFASIERLQKKKYKCPYCSHKKVKRVSTGIWQCGKCDAKFAGKAYTIMKKKTLKEMEEEVLELAEEEAAEDTEEEEQPE